MKHGKSKAFFWKSRLQPPGGLINFEKMGRKESFLDGIEGAHESRFNPPKKALLPPKRVVVPDFKKQTKRDSFIVKEPEILAYVDDPPPLEKNYAYPSEIQEKKEEKQFQKVLIPGRLQYNPNIHAVRPKINLSVPKFEKMPKREMTFLKLNSEAPEGYDAT